MLVPTGLQPCRVTIYRPSSIQCSLKTPCLCPYCSLYLEYSFPIFDLANPYLPFKSKIRCYFFLEAFPDPLLHLLPGWARHSSVLPKHPVLMSAICIIWSSSPWHRWTTVHLFTHWKTSGLFSVWGYYKSSGSKHLCTSFCVNTSLHFSRIISKSIITELYGNCILVLWETARVSVPFHIPTSHEWVIQLLYLLASILYHYNFLF